MAGGERYELGRFGRVTDKWPNGQYCVYIHFDDGRPRRRIGLAVSLERPQAEAFEAMQQFIRARKGALLQERGYLVGDLAELYFEDRAREGKTDYVKVRRYIWDRSLKPVFGALSLQSLSAPVTVDGQQRTICHKYAFERESEINPRTGEPTAAATIYNELSLIRTIVNWADKRGIAKRVHVWRGREPDARDRVISIEEFHRLLDACEQPHIRLFVVIAICTGARRQAILELTWDRVDFEKRTVDFRLIRKISVLNTSSKKGRAKVDMNEFLYRELEMAKRWARTEHVIEWAGKPVKNAKKGLAAAFERAAIEGRFNGAHLLRHSLATWVADAGHELRVVQRLLGHSDIGSTQRYAKHQTGYLRPAVSVVDRALNLESPGGKIIDGEIQGEKGSKTN
jgi:integrase